MDDERERIDARRIASRSSKLENMMIHNWQATAIGALQEATEAHLLSKLIKY